MKFSMSRGRAVIGLTGPIASGKSLALDLFIKEGALGISADAVSASLLTEPALYNRISRKFSPVKILTNGKLDKKKLAAEIFGSPAKRKWLEALLHPRILKRIHSLITSSPEKIAVVETPLLFEAGLAECFTFTVCLAAPAATLEARALKRGWSWAQYRARVKAQLAPEEKYARADIVLDNAGAPRELAEKIKFICRFLKETAQGKKK
ncbi:MAG TPA: dephospho-CoA kinase [Elusimicrobia bacterium]|nr:MAG: dephospho-CoA kinase [Elusimicrobia bacterium GWD2_63_28]HCC47827.1 dephospho-CoA kinase [Elusimicrobiota bacterium]